MQHQSIFRATQNVFNQNNQGFGRQIPDTTYIHIQHELFWQHVFLFCATLKIFSQHEITSWKFSVSLKAPS